MKKPQVLRKWTTENETTVIEHTKTLHKCWCCRGEEPGKCFCFKNVEDHNWQASHSGQPILPTPEHCTVCKGKGEYASTTTHKQQKFLCIGGSRSSERLTVEEAGKEYVLYNAANFNRGRNRDYNKEPRVILVCRENLLK